MAAVLPHPLRPNGTGRRTDSKYQEPYLVNEWSQGTSTKEPHSKPMQSQSQVEPDEKEWTEPREPNYKHGPPGARILQSGSHDRNLDMSDVHGEALDGEDEAECSVGIGGLAVDIPADKEERERILRLPPDKLYELTSSSTWLPIRKSNEDLNAQIGGDVQKTRGWTISNTPDEMVSSRERPKDRSQSTSVVSTPTSSTEDNLLNPVPPSQRPLDHGERSQLSDHNTFIPLLRRRLSSSKDTGSSKNKSSRRQSKVSPLSLQFGDTRFGSRFGGMEDPQPSPMPSSIPIPPLSLPTHLQLELSAGRPSPLYIHRSVTSDFPYESSRVKIDRLKDFFFLPPQLEQILWFGALACLDAWLYSFTILPLRFLKALSILGQFWGRCISHEARFIACIVYFGMGRMWRRRQARQGNAGSVAPQGPKIECTPKAEKLENNVTPQRDTKHKARGASTQRPRRTKSVPSTLSANQKADILKGFLILISSSILMYFDASRMYHGIRGQAAIKLYVIYNVLEICDRLFSAIGQDVLECLFSQEALERKPNGRSKVWRPFWLFVLALCYNVVHSTALFYQVITLNVAVNSYSNALLTLLMSNQFVEIKSAVFKKFEKENLFQLTCADVVERFQLWLMLMIIASRNIIETGGLSLNSSSASSPSAGASPILPMSFTIFPKWTGQVMGPFFLVLGSEMLVDWIKHAYITKFNNTKPAIYGRFLDVLAKDYYSNAFANQNLTRRVGLPVIPLACLCIRASVQTYQMFLATYEPPPLPSTATSISLESATASPATTAALQHIDHIFRRALSRSSFGAGDPTLSSFSPSMWNLDDIIAFSSTTIFFLVLFLVLLALKLVLGMILLSFSRNRYKGMKKRETTSVHADGRRVGGWGVVEVDEDKRRWIYADDLAGARRLREREREIREKEKRVEKEGGESFAGVSRYAMVAKRIW